MDDQLFQQLVSSITEMHAVERGAAEPARASTLAMTQVTLVRQRLRLSQPRFAKLLGISVRTLQNWEQGHRQPTGAARVLLRVAEKHPQTVLDGAAD